MSSCRSKIPAAILRRLMRPCAAELVSVRNRAHHTWESMLFEFKTDKICMGEMQLSVNALKSYVIWLQTDIRTCLILKRLVHIVYYTVQTGGALPRPQVEVFPCPAVGDTFKNLSEDDARGFLHTKHVFCPLSDGLSTWNILWESALDATVCF